MSRSMIIKSVEALIIVSISCVFTNCNAIDTISAGKFIKDDETMISSGGSFEVGFFSPGNSKYRYVGIWYKNISVTTVVWVANRNFPIKDNSGVLRLTDSGSLNVVCGTNEIILWASSNTSNQQVNVRNPVAQILESGNLVIRELNGENSANKFVWQSFDYPTDTQLPGMKLGINFVMGLERFLSSWKNSDDPAPGEFTYHLDPTGYPQIILKKGLNETYRTGPWNGLRFSGRPSFKNNTIYTHKLVRNKEEVYYMFELIGSVQSRFVLNHSGVAQRWTWVEQKQNWELFLTAPTDYCDTYKLCGPYGSCNSNNGPVCSCLDRFVPKHADEWDKAYWSEGCVRAKPLDCIKRDGFRKYSHVKLPDTRSSWFNESMPLKECESKCLKSCSCMAYASLNINGSESGCLQWIGELIDIKEFSEGGQDLYVKVAFSDSDMMVTKSGSEWGKSKIIAMSLSLSVGMFVLGLCLAVVYIRKKKQRLLLKREGICGQNLPQDDKRIEGQDQKEDLELPFFRLSTIAHATSNFSINNKLGQGGFGPVFKGVLEDGQEIAVKQLSKTSKQGPDEFMNELKFIAKLQHRNLVRLIGYCVQGDEKMLIYEYMPNRSLDSYIFDENRSALLDWPQRFHIIDGVARGLLYLHQDSRLRIIHRDLKASNILLDSEMNPKISDFGMARSFTKNDSESNTNRVVGTYGYMPPEYAVDGLFSVKSDVFSFGVLVLEIVSGEKNRGFIHRDHRHNLLGHAWRLHQEGRSDELVRAHIRESQYTSQVIRSIHIGLLCVQQSPEDRPNMSTVVMLLGSEGDLPQPTQPGFFTERNIVESEYFSSVRATCLTDDASSTLLEGR